MGKRKNKQKDEDRIVQRRRIKKDPEGSMLQEIEPEEQEISEDESLDSSEIEKMIEMEEETQNHEKSKVQKFLEKFKIEGTGEGEEQDHSNRLSKIISKISVIQDDSTIMRSYEDFFEKSHKDLLASKLEEVKKVKVEKKSEKDQIREKMKEIFNIGVTGEAEINPYKKHEQLKEKEKEQFKDFKDPTNEALNNKVEIKEYQIRKELRSKKGYSVENIDEYVIDELAQSCLSNGLNCSKANFHESVKIPTLTPALQIQFGIMNNYHDLVVIDQDERRNESFRKLYISHIINHLTKAPLQKDKIDEKPQEYHKFPDKQKQVINPDEDDDIDVKRTKGFTNCKILILTPFKGDATSIINELLSVYGEKKLRKNSKKERFVEEYEEGSQMDDDFRMGIAITGKGLRMFTPFSHSDIIVTSLVGLRLATGQPGDKDRDFSFLSSVEILVIDRAHALYMQNWQHMNELMSLFNRIPKHKFMTSNIHQIREYFFENIASFYRQTLVYSEFAFPELNSLKTKFMNNYKGCLSLRPFYTQIPHPKINQEFVKFEITDFKNEMDERIDFFKKKIWDEWNKEEMDKSVIFVSSYFEYIKLKSMFVKQNAPVFGICEYTKKRDVHKRISLFKNGTLPYIMETERAYYFDIGSVRGMKNILFFSLPKNSFIYQEMLSHLDAETVKHSKSRVVTLFNKCDALALERIIGTDNAKEFLADYNKATSFVL